MSISFSALKTHKDLTLPSIEMWGTNMNILKDPPKSITTRKIDKVGQDSKITEMIDAAGDRACEAINVYARGVNPSVSVSYTNYGNNGGGSAINRSGQTNASLPYKVNEGGAFRPPVVSPRELLPLSRQPRLVTQAITNPEAINYAKRAMCPDPNSMREVRKLTLEKNNIRPTARYQIERQVQDINPENSIIENPINISGYSGVRTMDVTQTQEQKPGRQIGDVTYKVITTNPGTLDKSRKIETVMHTDKYLQDLRVKAVTTNPGRKGDGKKYVNKTIELVKNVPTHNATTNPGIKGFGDFYENNAREVKLAPKVRPEPGVQNLANLPSKMRVNQPVTFRNNMKCSNKDSRSMLASRYV